VTTSETGRRSVTFALVRVDPPHPRLDLSTFSRAAGLHPGLVERLYALGLLEATRDGTGELWFDPSQLHEVARVQRLHAGMPLDYAAVGLVCDLLDRIADLETSVRRARTHHTGG
jgi:chaperone modulatory protein CbpM